MVAAKGNQAAVATRLSSPGLTGRPSTPRPLVLDSGASEYWIPAFAGMTAGVSERLMVGTLK